MSQSNQNIYINIPGSTSSNIMRDDDDYNRGTLGTVWKLFRMGGTTTKHLYVVSLTHLELSSWESAELRLSHIILNFKVRILRVYSNLPFKLNTYDEWRMMRKRTEGNRWTLWYTRLATTMVKDVLVTHNICHSAVRWRWNPHTAKPKICCLDQRQR